MSIANKMTPYYELDLSNLRLNFLHFQNTIDDYHINGIIAYSIKANYNKDIILTLNELGSHFEVCSEYEILKMFEYDVSINKLVINGFITDKNLLLKCINQGAVAIFGSINDITWLSNCHFNSPINIGLRLNLDYIKEGAEYFSFNSRFGISLEKNTILLKSLEKRNIYIKCLQTHFSGNSRNPKIYLNILKELLRLKEEYDLTSVSIIDIGGGYKISNDFWQFKDYIKSLATIKNQIDNFKIIFEPGNSLVRTVGTYYSTVIDTFEIYKKRYVLIDGSSIHLNKHNQNIQYEYDLKFKNIRRDLFVNDQIVVGNSCKESDVIMILKNEKSLKIGDTLVIKNVGAYTLNEVSDFILKKPNIFLLK